ncbi:MAG: molybdopterin dinucleotide binding domain-containing protein, partial [Candidatus Binataceae bacterium]
FGRRDLPVYRLDQAETIVAFGADFLETWGSPVEQTRQYADFRKPRMRKGGLTIGRSVYVNPRMGITGAKCDAWVGANPGSESAVAMAVLNVIISQGWLARRSNIDREGIKAFVAGYDPASVSEQSGVSVSQISQIAEWFGNADSAVALAGGDDPQTYLAAYLLNALTGNVGKTMVFLDGAPAAAASRPEAVKATVDAIGGGAVDVVVIAAGANPVFTMPPLWSAGTAIRHAPFVVWTGDAPDETAEAANLLLPTHHALESWRDSAPRAGLHGLGQPVMQPVFRSRQLHDILIESAHLVAGEAATIPWENGADAVSASWEELQGKIAADSNPKDFWNQARRNGGVFQAAKELAVSLNPAVLKTPPTARLEARGQFMLAAFPHPFLYDGRGANKPWLQEIPEPSNQIVWDSWAEIHPETAATLGLQDHYKSTYLYAGIDVIEISTPSGKFNLAVHITPLVKPGVIAAPIGNGHSAYGRYASHTGVNLWAFIPEGARGVAVQARKTEAQYKLVTPLGKSDMMGRSIIESMSVEQLASGAKTEIEREQEENTPKTPYEMYVPWKYDGHKWGMTIDVNSCTGCSACVAACYAENNIPFGGKSEVDRGRIMSWIRVERFIPNAEEAAHAPNLHIAPIMCQQCDHAPCEPVCPVFASHHTPEGLNAQIYNRCVGTRFCENNCPYKVRRFNWFLPEWPEPLNLQLNPDVTVRGAGVMEKCTFCIQRITTAEIDARTEDRKLVDGEIIPACAQACPARAISFGDLNDPNSAMLKRRADNAGRNYTMLPEFNALPQVTYLRSLYAEKGKA